MTEKKHPTTASPVVETGRPPQKTPHASGEAVWDNATVTTTETVKTTAVVSEQPLPPPGPMAGSEPPLGAYWRQAATESSRVRRGLVELLMPDLGPAAIMKESFLRAQAEVFRGLLRATEYEIQRTAKPQPPPSGRIPIE